VSDALGIDLGTPFTAAAVSRTGRVEIVGMGNHSSSIPSAVLLRDDGELLVGDAATRRAYAVTSGEDRSRSRSCA
jgi:molecular chaperone DnaK (HSP70)